MIDVPRRLSTQLEEIYRRLPLGSAIASTITATAVTELEVARRTVTVRCTRSATGNAVTSTSSVAGSDEFLQRSGDSESLPVASRR